jgi:hypothetical protein
MAKEQVAYYDHRHSGIYRTNILREVKLAEGETIVLKIRLGSCVIRHLNIHLINII